MTALAQIIAADPAFLVVPCAAAYAAGLGFGILMGIHIAHRAAARRKVLDISIRGGSREMSF